MNTLIIYYLATSFVVATIIVTESIHRHRDPDLADSVFYWLFLFVIWPFYLWGKILMKLGGK